MRLKFATREGNLKEVTKILDEGGSAVTKLHWLLGTRIHPLVIASGYGHADVVRLFLQRDRHLTGTVLADSLEAAAVRCHLDAVSELLNHNAPIRNALIYAVIGGNAKIIEALLAHGADINVIYGAKRLSLHRVPPESLRALRKAGAKLAPDLIDDGGPSGE
jgi:ankyrin repeat protein